MHHPNKVGIYTITINVRQPKLNNIAATEEYEVSLVNIIISQVTLIIQSCVANFARGTSANVREAQVAVHNRKQQASGVPLVVQVAVGVTSSLLPGRLFHRYHSTVYRTAVPS